jgi:hypothetical protein
MGATVTVNAEVDSEQVNSDTTALHVRISLLTSNLSHFYAFLTLFHVFTSSKRRYFIQANTFTFTGARYHGYNSSR